MHRLDERARWLARHVLPLEPALRAWLARKNVPGLEVDDIIQETYARLSVLESVSQIRNVRTYTFQAAHSVILAHVRRAKIVSLSSLAHLEADFADDSPDPETIVADRAELSRLGSAIAALSPRVREVFLLRRVEGLSQREVAKRLGIAESTVEKQMSHGFRQLARIFGRSGKRTGGASKVGMSKSDLSDVTADGTGD